MNKKQISFTIESRLENVSLVSTAVNNICSQIPITAEEAHAIELCVTEAVVNSIKHAYQSLPGYKVEVELAIETGKIEIRVIDTGRSMNPDLLNQIPPHYREFSQDNIESIPSSGRGLMIIKSHMDTVSYQEGNPFNALSMTKKITIAEDFKL